MSLDFIRREQSDLPTTLQQYKSHWAMTKAWEAPCSSTDGWCPTRSSWYVHFLQPWNCTQSILPSHMSFHQLMNTAPIIPKTQRISTINRMWKPETVKTLAQLYIARWQKSSSPLELSRLWWPSNHLTQQTSRDCRFLMGNPFKEIADLLRTNQQTLHYRTSHSLLCIEKSSLKRFPASLASKEVEKEAHLILIGNIAEGSNIWSCIWWCYYVQVPWVSIYNTFTHVASYAAQSGSTSLNNCATLALRTFLSHLHHPEPTNFHLTGEHKSMISSGVSFVSLSPCAIPDFRGIQIHLHSFICSTQPACT